MRAGTRSPPATAPTRCARLRCSPRTSWCSGDPGQGRRAEQRAAGLDGRGDAVGGEGYYFAGDGAKYDADGDIWLLGRVDDVMNVSGHRISTTEVESALVSHPTVAEAAVVGATDATTGQGIVAFVILRGDAVDSGEELVKTLRQHVRKEIGPIA